MTTTTRRKTFRAGLWLAFLSSVLLGSGGTAHAGSQPAAALALPYVTSPTVQTSVNLVNASDVAHVLRIIAISGDLATAYESRSIACEVAARGSTSVSIADNAGTLQMQANCASGPILTLIPGAQGVVFVVLEDPSTGLTISTDAIYGESTVVDGTFGAAWSADAIAYRAGVRGGLEQNDGDRTYRLNGGEYEVSRESGFIDYEFSTSTLDSKLVLFTPDATTGQGAPRAGVQIFFYDEEAIVVSASHEFSGFDLISLTDINVNFSSSVLGSVHGFMVLQGDIVARSDSHDDQPSFGDGNFLRKSPVLAWLLRDASVPTRSAARRFVPGNEALSPVGDDQSAAFRLLEDADGDGIEDPIDTAANAASDDFDDASFGGMTDGTITSRGDQTLRIGQGGNEHAIQMETSISGGAAPATIDVCGGTAQLSVDAGTFANYTCSSVDLSVRFGLVEIQFALNGQLASIDVGAGNSVLVDSDSGLVAADAANPDPIVIETPGGDVEVDPGESLLLGVEIEILWKPWHRWFWWFRPHAWVAVLGSETLDVRDVVRGSLAFGPAGAPGRKFKRRDVDRDGDRDLLGRYRMRDTGIDLHTDDEACLSGDVQTDSGTYSFVACDTLVREPPPKPWWAWW